MSNFFIGIIILFLSGIFTCFLGNKLKILISTLFTGIGAVFFCIPALNSLLTGDFFVKTFVFNELFGPVNFVIDPLAAFFIIIISVMSLVTIIYSNGYLKPYIVKGKNINAHLLFFTLLIASMLLVVTCQNALMFLVCWEIMSLSSFFLVIFEHEKKEVLKAGIKYLVFMHISVIFIITAFAFASIKSGGLDFSSFIEIFNKDVHFANIIFILAFIGFGTKAGFVPFHNWLPDAHPAAPSHVSAIMSGVMIKTGIYGILRILTLIGTPSKSISYVVLIIAIISALYSILYAITQHDFKKSLAYSSMENISIIGIGIGVGMLGLAYNNPTVAILGFAGGILHILNHAIFKELLFFSAGSVYLETHTRNIETLGGLIKSMPKNAFLFLIGSIAICGLPPFNGFVSEILIYFGMFKGLSINNFFSVIILLFAIAGLALVGTMALLCFTKLFSVIFLGLPRTDIAQKVQNDSTISMILPMSFLAILALMIGLFPQYIFTLILKPVNSFVDTGNINLYETTFLMQIISIFALSFIIFLSILILLKNKLNKGKVEVCETWGCGYNKGNNHMQYTASSYANPFLSMLNPLFKKVFDVEKPRKLFPQSAHFSMHIEDIEEAYVIEPVLKTDEWFLSKFETLQSGNIQSYIKYGLIFLVIIIVGCFFI